MSMDINFTPFPKLSTERLKLRRITNEDVEEVFSIRSNPETMKYVPRPLAKTHQDSYDFIKILDECIEQNTAINWGITYNDDDQLLGMICLLRMQPENFRTEVGYILAPAHHGKGIVQEALTAVIRYAFDTLKFHSVEALIDPANKASENVLLRQGFVKEAHFKENFFYDGQFLDSVIYSLINSK